ncbi:MAG: ABC transporter permease [Acidobacteria bacterium]|nr:MAG: ABC transporter permease [Acidobacteriota bacterium]
MLRFALRRLGTAAATLLGSATLVFFLTALTPGDPARLLSGGPGRPAPSRQELAAFRAGLGLDRPLPARYATWLRRAAALDLGRSFRDARPVRERIAETLPLTLALNLSALALATLAGIPLGIASALRPGSRLDRSAGWLADVLFAVPGFVLGLSLLVLVAGELRLVPVFSDPSAGPSAFLLPVVTLAAAALAPISRVTRNLVAEALRTPPALAGLTRGEGRAGSVARALRASSGGFAGLYSALVPGAAAGSVLVERVFSFPGSGALLAEAVFARDYPVVLGLTLVTGAIVVLSSLAADLVAAWLDPRLADGARREDAA